MLVYKRANKIGVNDGNIRVFDTQNACLVLILFESSFKKQNWMLFSFCNHNYFRKKLNDIYNTHVKVSDCKTCLDSYTLMCI